MAMPAMVPGGETLVGKRIAGVSLKRGNGSQWTPLEKAMADCAGKSDALGGDLTAVLVASLATTRTAASLAGAVAESSAAADASCGDRQAACSAGCPHCCVLNVAVLIPEAMVIADWLMNRLEPAALTTLRKRLSSHQNWGRWMDDEERIARKAVCPLLDDVGNCSVHQVRPLACRGVSSLDRISCQAAFDPIISDQERLVPADLLRREVFDAAFIALAKALRYHGLDDRSIELGVGVLAFLEHPDFREWYLSGRCLPRELWG